MRLADGLLFLQLASTLACGQQPSWIVGKTQDCFARKVIHPAQVDIYLLDPQKSPEAVRILNDMEKQVPKGDENPQAFFASYQRLTSAVQKTRSVARTRSDEAGNFSFDALRDQKKLVVLGLAEREDEPAYYASMPVNLRAGKNSVTLDFDRGNTCKSQ